MSDPLHEADWLANTVGVRRLDASVLEVTEDERLSWLNGQITNDVSKLAPGRAVYALAVNLTGKILADLYAVDLGDRLALIVPTDAREPLMAHFEKYIVMEDVELEARDDLAVLTAQGPRAAEAIAAIGRAGHPCVRLGTDGRDLLVPREEADATSAALAAAAADLGGGEVSAAGWELARLRAGIPAFGADFGDKTLPQEAGLAGRAVSFVKGCYLGQEVVCMLENRGKLRRRLVVLESGTALPAGTAIAEGERELGAVTSSAWDGDRARALALVKASAAEPGRSVVAGGAEARIVGVVGSGDVQPRNL